MTNCGGRGTGSAAEHEGGEAAVGFSNTAAATRREYVSSMVVYNTSFNNDR